MPWDARRNIQMAMRRKSSASKPAARKAEIDDTNSVGRNYNRSRATKLGPATKITRKGGKTKTRTRK